MNGLAYDRIVTKCSQVIKIEKKDCPSLIKEMEKFLTEYGKNKLLLIKKVELIESYRDDVVKVFADLYFNGNTEKATRSIKIVSPINLIKYIWFRIFIILFVIIFMTYFLITYLPGKNFN
jgi:hypothetical protein